MNTYANREANALAAAQHVRLLESNYSQEVSHSSKNTQIYTGSITVPPHFHQRTVVELKAMDTVTALFDISTVDCGRTCILNFASYKNPGGKFLEGSVAQEEALCRRSTLYPVLQRHIDDYYQWNRSHLNRALYMHRALYSKDILFFDFVTNYLADVLTCAAPNNRAYSRYNVGPECEAYNLEALEERIKFVLDIAEISEVDTLLLGAWGCGVFGQNPYVVSELFFKYIPSHNIPRIVFAVPDYTSDNYRAFEHALYVHGELL